MLKLVHALDTEFESVLEYYNSFSDTWDDLNSYAIRMVENGKQAYFDYVNTHDHNMYFLIDEDNPSYIIGFGSFEDSYIMDYHKEYLNTGNIRYGVRPNERKKRYGTTLLNLLLEKCEEIGMGRVCVSCLKDNEASKKVIINNGGKLDKEFYDDWSGKEGLKFWIKIHPKLIDRGKRLVRLTKEYMG